MAAVNCERGRCACDARVVCCELCFYVKRNKCCWPASPRRSHISLVSRAQWQTLHCSSSRRGGCSFATPSHNKVERRPRRAQTSQRARRARSNPAAGRLRREQRRQRRQQRDRDRGALQQWRAHQSSCWRDCCLAVASPRRHCRPLQQLAFSSLQQTLGSLQDYVTRQLVAGIY